MAKGQKEAVIEAVMLALPTFQKGVDNAILKLSEADLESIKNSIMNQILNGAIEYGKNITLKTEVRTYARSMVMNHLKKAKELNGGHSYVSATSNSNSPARVASIQAKTAPKGVNLDLLPEELKEYVRTLA